MTTPALGRFRLSLLTLAAAVLTLSTGSTARAQVWNEVGDAGSLVQTAQVTVGSGPLLTILGNLASPTDVDVYCIHYEYTPPGAAMGARALSAGPPPGLPLIQLQCAGTQDPNVWLFDAAGNGVLSGSTCAAGNKTIFTPAVPLTPGTYYVAVSYYGYDPQSALGPIWLPGGPTSRAPDGPGAPASLVGWAGTPILGPLSPYQLNLTYMSYCSAPVPTVRTTWGTLKSIYR